MKAAVAIDTGKAGMVPVVAAALALAAIAAVLIIRVFRRPAVLAVGQSAPQSQVVYARAQAAEVEAPRPGQVLA